MQTMKKNHSQKRGFTLVEVVITLAVTIILMTTISSLIVAVVSERRRSVGDYDVSVDIYFAENAIYDWFDNFAGDSFTLTEEKDEDGNIYGVIAIVSGGRQYKISFDKENKKLTTPKYPDGWTLSEISNITFEIYTAHADGTTGNVIKASMSYEGANVPISILLSGRADINETP